MYARILSTQVKPDAINEFARVYQESVLPQLRQERGFRQIFILHDPATDHGFAFALFDTLADAQASRSGYSQSRLPLVAPYLAGTPTDRDYVVVVQG